jgi:hypothetical protein
MGEPSVATGKFTLFFGCLYWNVALYPPFAQLRLP